MRKLFFLVLLAIVMAAGYFGYQSYNDRLPEPQSQGVKYTNGNSSGNIANAGYLVRYKNELIGNVNANHQGIYKSDLKFKKQVKLTDDEGLFFNTDGEYVYYINFTDKHTIYKVKLNGQGREKLNRTQSDALSYENGWLYYLDRSKGSVICKLSTDGKTSQVLLKDQYCTNLLVKDGWIYYILKGEIQRVNVDGGDRKVIAEDVRTTYYEDNIAWKGNFDVSGNNLYYPSTDGYMRLVRIDGKHNQEIISGKIESINIYNGYVYYFDSKQRTIYRFNMEDPKLIDFIVGGGLYYNINIVSNDGVIYKDKSITDGPLYMVLMDLTPKKLKK